MQTLHPNWEPRGEDVDRIDQTLVEAIWKHPDKFKVESRHEFAIKFVHPDVIEAQAWRIDAYDGAESVEVRQELLNLWKIRQLTNDPEILKLTEIPFDAYGHVT